MEVLHKLLSHPVLKCNFWFWCQQEVWINVMCHPVNSLQIILEMWNFSKQTFYNPLNNTNKASPLLDSTQENDKIVGDHAWPFSLFAPFVALGNPVTFPPPSPTDVGSLSGLLIQSDLTQSGTSLETKRGAADNVLILFHSWPIQLLGVPPTCGSWLVWLWSGCATWLTRCPAAQTSMSRSRIW